MAKDKGALAAAKAATAAAAAAAKKHEDVSKENDFLQSQLTSITEENAKKTKAMVDLQVRLACISKNITSGTGSSSDVGRFSQRPLSVGQKATVSNYVSALYARLKFLNDDTLQAKPKIVGKAMDQLGLLTPAQQADYLTATVKEVKYLLSQKRAYSKKQIMKKYIGMCLLPASKVLLCVFPKILFAHLLLTHFCLCCVSNSVAALNYQTKTR